MFSHHNVAIEAVELRKEQAMPVRRDTQSELGRLVECCYILGRVMREIDEANNRLRQRTRCGHVVNTVSRYCKVEPIHGIRDLGFLASAAGHFPKACRRALATDIENRFPVGRNQRRVAAVSRYLLWIAAVRIHVPDLQTAAAVRTEVNGSTVSGPAWNTVGSTAIGQLMRNSITDVHRIYVDVPAEI